MALMERVVGQIVLGCGRLRFGRLRAESLVARFAWGGGQEVVGRPVSVR